MQYQAACALAKIAGGAIRLGFGLEKAEAHMTLPGKPFYLVKQHDFRSVCRRWHPDAARFICSHRDPRDVLASMLQLGKERGAGWIAYIIRINNQWASLPGTLMCRYEDLLLDLPGEIGKIASHMGIRASATDLLSVASELSLEKQREFTDSLPRKDEASQLKSGHVQGGDIGKWQHLLSPEQADMVVNMAGDWMKENDYDFG